MSPTNLDAAATAPPAEVAADDAASMNIPATCGKPDEEPCPNNESTIGAAAPPINLPEVLIAEPTMDCVALEAVFKRFDAKVYALAVNDVAKDDAFDTMSDARFAVLEIMFDNPPPLDGLRMEEIASDAA